jgi:hypothetical protein
MKYIVTGIIIIASSCIAYTQNINKVKAKGEYTTKFETNNVELFLAKCTELAKINAIENIFGRVIMQGNSTYIQNSTNDSKNESYNSFNFISDTYVNGEWVSDIEEPEITYPQVEYKGKKELWIKVAVNGYVSEIRSVPTSFQFSPLSCDNNINCRTDVFKERQDIFFYFKSPVSGYLAIYLDAPLENKTFKIFPYKKSKNVSNRKIEKDIEYILFSKKKDLLKEPVDEIIPYLTKTNIPEVNKLFVMFSPDKEIIKPILNSNISNKNFELPDSITSPEFQKWIQIVKSYNKNIQISTSYITINP